MSEKNNIYDMLMDELKRIVEDIEHNKRMEEIYIDAMNEKKANVVYHRNKVKKLVKDKKRLEKTLRNFNN